MNTIEFTVDRRIVYGRRLFIEFCGCSGSFPIDARIGFIKELRKEDGDYIRMRMQPFKPFLNVLQSIQSQEMNTLADQYQVGLAELRQEPRQR